MWLTDLADVIRANTGLTVIEEPGWKTRGHGPMLSLPQDITCHHTAAPASSYKTNPYPSLKTVRDGRDLGLPTELLGPLAHIGLQRDCKVRVIAAGLCYHAGRVFEDWQTNGRTLGIEAEHDGVSAWPADMYAAYVELCAGLVRGYRPPHGVQGHKEVAAPLGRKNDPNFNMGAFRTAVASFNPTEEDMPLTDADAEKVVDHLLNRKLGDSSVADCLARARALALRFGETGDLNVQLDRIEEKP
jgi:hypothetical protein